MFLKLSTILGSLLLIGVTAKSENGRTKVTPLDTTQPNEFYFTSDLYYVDEDATNAVIEVGFVPGDRSFTGSVDYCTRNGTATAGQDYIGVTNTLGFSGPAPTKTFTIVIQVDALLEGNETVQLSLSNTNAIISRSNATLVIIDKTPRPRMDVVRSNNSFTLSWPTNFTNFALQKTTDLTTTNWAAVPQLPSITNGRFNVITQDIGNAFYRLIPSSGP